MAYIRQALQCFGVYVGCFRDTWLVCVINSATGLIAGLCIFSVLGFMAKQQGVSVDKVVQDGMQLAHHLPMPG